MLQEKKCPKCGTRNYGSEIKYCMSCGYKFIEDDKYDTDKNIVDFFNNIFNQEDHS